MSHGENWTLEGIHGLLQSEQETVQPVAKTGRLYLMSYIFSLTLKYEA